MLAPAANAPARARDDTKLTKIDRLAGDTFIEGHLGLDRINLTSLPAERRWPLYSLSIQGRMIL
jgi:hypothetical protein